jgi:DHA1 family bicyclomycin/chloramphenicol resistance-like MFS transporter
VARVARRGVRSIDDLTEHPAHPIAHPIDPVPVTSPTGRRELGRREFAVMLAMTMAMTALAIDIMLPAFADIRAVVGLPADSPDVAQLVTAFFLGLALAGVPAGLLADRFGRKPVLHVGLVLYALGAVGTLLAPSLGWMLAARFCWGLGAAGPRVVAIAIVRDRYRGTAMARVMSTVMAMFILVPVIAPSIGALLLRLGPWQLVFGFCAVAATALNVWAMRLPETLRPEHRRPLRLGPIVEGAAVVVRTRQTVLLGLAMTATMAAFMSYLASAELIIDETFGLGDHFALIFGVIAAGMGVATFTNGRIVGGLGMWRVLQGGLATYTLLSVAVLTVAVATDGRPSAALFLPLLAVLLANHSLLIPNINSAAMEPVGAVAGTAAALLGAVTTLGGSLIGARVDQAFDGTIRPLAVAFVVSATVASACFAGARRAHRRVGAGERADVAGGQPPDRAMT